MLIALVPTLLWRRAHPLLMLAIAFGVGSVFSVATGGDPQLVTTAYFLLLVYAVVRWGSGRAMVAGGALLLASSALSFALGPTTIGDVVGGLAVVVTTVTLGVAFRWRAAARARELDRVKLLEREQLARDLHDTVAHHVSAIAIQAQAGTAVAATDPDAAAEVLRVIEGEASRTLDEMRSMVRVLRRDDAGDLAPSPGLAELRRLATTDAGEPTVDVRIVGDVEAVPPMVASAVYRLAQEAVTKRVGTPATRPGSTSASTSTARGSASTCATTAARGIRHPRLRHHRHGRARGPARRHLRGGPGAGRRVGRDRRAPVGLVDVSVRVLIADDQELVRTGLRMILDAQPGIEVVGEAADGAAAVALARGIRPDVCLFDIRMPVMDGLEATLALAGPGVDDPLPVVVITTFDLDEYVYAALRAGARGFLLKNAGATLLAQAVHAAARGDALIDPNVTVRLIRAFAASPPAGQPAQAQPHAADRAAHPARGGRARDRRARARQHRDRRRAAHLAQHREDAPREPHGQDRRPQPGRGRDLGVPGRADRCGPGARVLDWAPCRARR